MTSNSFCTNGVSVIDKSCQIAFYTSVVGMGGSEVLVADAMEAAHNIGANLICWSDPKAAVRRIVAARQFSSAVQFRDWPLRSQAIASDSSPVESGSPSRLPTPSRQSLVRRMWGYVPFEVKRQAGYFATAWKFRKQLLELRPDLLFVNVNGSEAVSLGGWLARIPVVNCYHLSYTHSQGLISQFSEYISRRCTSDSATLTVHTSARVRDQWCRALSFGRDRTRLIYNGVAPSLPSDSRFVRESLGIPGDKFVFCVPGRLDPIKGHRYLLQALSLVRDHLRDVVVLICGHGALQADLEIHSESAGLSGLVRFLGWRGDLPEILRGSNAVILPSVASENLSVAVLEGLMAGVPAIVTDVGGMPEAVQHGVTGLVVPPRDVQSLATAITSFASDRQRVEEYGKNAAEDASVRFSRARMLSDYARLFKEVLTSPMSRRGESP